MTTVDVQREFDYIEIDSRDWLETWSNETNDVTDHWQEVIAKAHALQLFGEHYTEAQTYRAMIEHMRKKEYSRGYGEHFFSDWSGNRENVFSTDLSVTAVEYESGADYPRILVFVELAPGGIVSTPDAVFQFEDWDSVFEFVSPRIQASCPTSNEHGHWETDNGYTLTSTDWPGPDDVPVDAPLCPICGDTLELSVWVDA